MELPPSSAFDFETYEVPLGSLEEAFNISFNESKENIEDIFLARFGFQSFLTGTIEDVLKQTTELSEICQAPVVPVVPPNWEEEITIASIEPQSSLAELDECFKKHLNLTEESRKDESDKKDSEKFVKLDRWGFVISDNLSHAGEPSSAKSSKQKSKESVGDKKWNAILKDWESYSEERKKKTKQKIRKGVPDSVRGQIWLKIGEIDELRSQDPELFLRSSKEESSFSAQILKDINRTLPHHVFYREKKGKEALYKALNAYANHDKQIGYCQGMSLITALFLLYMTDEDAFYFLIRLMKSYDMAGLFELGFSGLYKCFYIHDQLLEDWLPRLSQHFKTQGVMPSMYCTKWYMEVFSSALPFPFVVRVWDLVLCEGISALFRVSMAILKVFQKELLKLSFENILEKLLNVSKSLINSNPDEMICLAMEFNLNAKRLNKLTKEYEANPQPLM